MKAQKNVEVYYLYLFYCCIYSYTWCDGGGVCFCISMGESYIYLHDYMCNQEESLGCQYLGTTLVFVVVVCFF